MIDKIDILGFSHIGFVVPSVEEFRNTWGVMLGADDWVQRDVPQPAGRVQLHGRSITEPSANRVAFAKVRGLSIELIEPLSGETSAADWLKTRGPGIQHVGVWVRDLATELEKLGDAVAVTYSAASLIPELADKPVTAMVPTDPAARPPFWAYVQPLGVTAGWELELLDAKFEDAYRAYYGDYAFYPGDLPGTLTL